MEEELFFCLFLLTQRRKVSQSLSGGGHTESTEYTECRAEHYGLTQTAQTSAEACGAKFCVFLCILCATIFDKRTYRSAPFASLREEFHTELKVAVRTCEGKAIHGIHRKVSTYLRVSTRIFFEPRMRTNLH